MNIHHQIKISNESFERLVAQKDWRAVKEVLKNLPAVDIAEFIDDMKPEVAVVIFRLLLKPKAGEVFAHLSSNKGRELLEIFSRQQLSDVMNNLEVDDRVTLMEELPGRLTQLVLWSMKPEDQDQVVRLLGYPEESIGRLMNTRLVRVKSHWTIEKSLQHIRIFGDQAETLNVIYVVDDSGKLIDDLRLNQIVMADPQTLISEIMDHTFEALQAIDDQEEAVRMLSKYDRVAMPVVDTDGILVGLVTVDDVIDVAEEEATDKALTALGEGGLELHAPPLMPDFMHDGEPGRTTRIGFTGGPRLYRHESLVRECAEESVAAQAKDVAPAGKNIADSLLHTASLIIEQELGTID